MCIRHSRSVLSISMACLSPLAAAGAMGSDVDPWDGDWHTTVSVYAWLPGISAKTRFRLPSGTMAENHNDRNIYDTLSGAFMLDATFRKGRWAIYTDVDWVRFFDERGRFASIGGQRAGVSAAFQTRWNLKGGMVTLAGTYTVGYSSQGYVEVLLGARYLWLKGNLGWHVDVAGTGGRFDIADEGHLSRQTHVTDAVVGVRGRWTPFATKALFLPYYFDIGTGTRDRTQQYEGGIGYAFHWGDMALTYRDVEYHEHGRDAFLPDVRLSGPNFSLTWHF